MLRLITPGGFLIATRPHTRRLALSGPLNLTRGPSLVVIPALYVIVPSKVTVETVKEGAK